MPDCVTFIFSSVFIFSVMHYLYDDFGRKITVNLMGSFNKPANSSHDNILIQVKIGDVIRSTERFDIVQSGNDQIKPDLVAFDFDIDTLWQELNLSLQFTTNAKDAVPLRMSIDTHSLDTQVGAICGGIILILLNVFIITEVNWNLL